MKIVELLLLLLCLTTVAWAGSMTVTTGFGYYTYNGQPINYYSLPNGQYQIGDSLSYVETNSMPTVTINQDAAKSYYCGQDPRRIGC